MNPLLSLFPRPPVSLESLTASSPRRSPAAALHATANVVEVWHGLDGPEIWNANEANKSVGSSDVPKDVYDTKAVPGPRSNRLTTFSTTSPFWRLLMLSDGSMTRHLQLLAGTKVKVECMSMTEIGDETSNLPPEVITSIQGPRTQRQVLLRAGPDLAPLVYAASWWNSDLINKFLKDKEKPIWVSLAEDRIELHREILTVHKGYNNKIKELLQCQGDGPLYGRRYIFWNDGKPLCVIYEVFSDKLEAYTYSYGLHFSPKEYL